LSLTGSISIDLFPHEIIKNIYYQKEIPNHISIQVTKTIWLKTLTLKPHWNVGQHMKMNISETISIKSLSNKQIGNGQINVPSNIHLNLIKIR
jgi:hypothetical protein